MVGFRDRVKSLAGVPLRPQRKKDGALVIAVCSQKGGVGKTTTAVNLGAMLAVFEGKRVLVVDLDPQGHVEKSLGSILVEGIDYTPLSQILLARAGDVLDAVVRTQHENLHITAGDKALYEAEGTLTTKIGREFILAQALSLARDRYDIILIDCPPNLGNLTINALCAADYVLVPCEMSVLAFEGVSDLLSTFQTVSERLNPELKILGILFTRVDSRNATMNKLVEDAMKKQFKGSIFQQIIAVNTDLNKAQLEGVPIFEFAPRSSGANHYKGLAGEVCKILGSKKRRRAAS